MTTTKTRVTPLEAARMLGLDRQADALRWCRAHAVAYTRDSIALGSARIDAEQLHAAISREGVAR